MALKELNHKVFVGVTKTGKIDTGIFVVAHVEYTCFQIISIFYRKTLVTYARLLLIYRLFYKILFFSVNNKNKKKESNDYF